jgi:hypothetical protein
MGNKDDFRISACHLNGTCVEIEILKARSYEFYVFNGGYFGGKIIT